MDGARDGRRRRRARRGRRRRASADQGSRGYGGRISDHFVEREREHVRGFYRPDWDWFRAEAPSERTPPRIPLERARVALVATAGAVGPGQRPFRKGDEGDESFRLIDRDAPVRLVHPGYDTRSGARPRRRVFPRSRSGAASPHVARSARSRHAPRRSWAGRPTPRACSRRRGRPPPGCQQTVGLLHRVLDAHGIPAVSITQVAEVTALVQPSPSSSSTRSG